MWKLRVGVESYYLAQVASGLDDYYTGSGEAVGVWTGHGTAALGLGDRVDAADLRAVLAGLAPGTGLTPNGTQLKPHARRVPGFDLTFSVPKSVSVLYALGDPLVQGTVIDAAEAALSETLTWLEREAALVRRGSNDQTTRVALGDNWGTRRMATGGFVAARFRHRSSRAGDPHPHWHVLIANLAQGIDGRWSALDGTAIYAAKRTAGVLFQTALRTELTDRLGIEWGPVRNDSAEVASIPRRIVRLFSQRREQMEEWLETNGRSGPAAADAAMLVTRTAKPDTTFGAMTAEWHQRAEAAGFGPGDLERLLAAQPEPAVAQDERWLVCVGHEEDRAETNDDNSSPVAEAVGGFDEWLDHLLERRLTAGDSTFTRFELTQAVAAAMPPGVSISRVEQVVNRCLASPLIVSINTTQPPLAGPLGTTGDDRSRTYTSRRLLEIEARFLEQIAAGRETDPIPAGLVTQALAARPSIGFDQARAVQLLAQADAVQVMVGRPGTGKTYTLGALQAIYRSAGCDVIGLAPSARAARELEAGAGIGARTIASFLQHPPAIGLRTLVVVDEAGMAGTRDLAQVVDRVTAVGAKVILVGDHHQLAEVAAGGAFRAALETLSSTPGLVCELIVNRRQREVWEHDALDLLRSGDIPAAWAAYKAHDRVVLTDAPAELHQRLVADWRHLVIQPTDTGHPADVVVLAGTCAEAAALNRALRADRQQRGEFVGEAMTVGERVFQLGDRLVLLRNNSDQHDETGNRARVDNGMVGDVTSIDHAAGSLTIRLKGTHRHVTLDRTYLDAGHVDYGYALTVHKAQGLTCDHVLIAGPHGLNQEAGYVALSRARHTARLYATVRQDLELAERHARGIPLPSETSQDPETELVARLSRSGAKQLASTLNPDARTIDHYANRYSVPELVALAEQARQVHATAPCPEPDRAEFDAAVEFRRHATVGRRVRAFDRDNVGLIEAIDDRHGTVTVHFENARRRSSRRTFDWHQLLVIDYPEPVQLTPEAVERLEALAHTLEWRQQQWDDHHRRHGVEPGDAQRYEAAVEIHVERAARQLRSEPPTWLDHTLGQRPTDQARSVVWDDTILRIANWRSRVALDDSVPGLGPAPSDLATFERWHHLAVELLDIAAYLAKRTVMADHRSTLNLLQLLGRRDELRLLVSDAPPAVRATVKLVLDESSDSATLHAGLAAAAAQGARSAWILEHWPHIVELEQLERIVAASDPLGLWPVAQPAEVQAVLDQLRQVPEVIADHEPRTLAELAQLASEDDPAVRLQHRIDDLTARARRIDEQLRPGDAGCVTADQATLQRELRRLHFELADLERNKAEEQLLVGYVRTSDRHERARLVRAANVSHAALTEQPDWVIDHVRALHDNGRLAGTPIDEVADRISELAVRRDGAGATLNALAPSSGPLVEVNLPTF